MRSTLLFFGLLCSSALLVPAAANQASTPAPAPVNGIVGKWHFVYQTDGGDRDLNADFKLDGEQVSGKFDSDEVKGTFKDGNLDLAFPHHSDEAGITATLKMKGTLKGGKLAGTWQFSDYDGALTATRP